MAEKNPALGAADVVVTLGAPDDTEDYTLKVRPLVIKTLCATQGGLRPCIEKIQALDMNLMLQVVMLGTDAKGRMARELEDRFWLTAVTALIQPLTTFCLTLMNGGRPLTEAEPDDDEKDDEAAEGNG